MRSDLAMSHCSSRVPRGCRCTSGASRYEAGLLAEAELGGEGRHVHLLDDGFQHRQLARDVDIVVIHRSDLQQRLLPAGRLREPLSSLERADVIVLRQEDAELESTLRVYAGKECRFWRVRRTLSHLRSPPSARWPSARLPGRQNFLLHWRRLVLR